MSPHKREAVKGWAVATLALFNYAFSICNHHKTDLVTWLLVQAASRIGGASSRQDQDDQSHKN